MQSNALKSGILCLAVAGALVSTQARAIGLGAIEVKSKLNQPFVAEIPLTINSPGEANDLVVRIASPEAFERVGMDPRELSANLQFSVGKNARGEPVVRVTTPQRMNDPYVTFLVEADWGKGKMVREYTALLDPPHTASVPKRGISAPTVASTPMPLPAPAPTPEPRMTPPVAAAMTPAVQTRPIVQAPPVVQAPPPAVAAQPKEPLPPPAAAPKPEVPAPAPSPAPISAPAPAPIAAAPQTVPLPPPAASSEPLPLPPPPAAVPEPVSTPMPVAETPPQPAPEPAPAPVAEAPSPPPAPEATPAPEAPKSETTRAAPDAVTVNHGQTLSAIADEVRPADVSVNRMMIALERTNPDAFIHDNINLLKSGAVLRIPASADAQAITSAEANALVHEQVESWRQGAQPAPQLQPEETADTTPVKPTKPVAPAATAASEHPAASKAEVAPAATTEPDKSKAEPKTAATASVPKASKPRGAHLEIVPPVGNAAANSQSGASEGGSGSELRAQLAQTKEELNARNAEVSDLKSKVGDLEKMQTDSQKLLSMKDSQLAEMQQRLAELEKNGAASPAASGATPAPAASSEPASAASATSDTTASASPASTALAPATAAASPSKPAVAAPNKPAAQPVEPEPAESWYMQPFVWIGGGLLALGVILALMLKRPREAEPSPRLRSFDTDALAAGMTAARTEIDAPVHEPVLVPEVIASQPYQAAKRDEAAAPVVAAAKQKAGAKPEKVMPAEDDWALPVTPAAPSFVQQPVAAPAPTPAPMPAPSVTAVRPAVGSPAAPSREGAQTVATKLELARAYVDIGDADGARSMLEEVLIEGNAAQQQAAFELLDTLDG